MLVARYTGWTEDFILWELPLARGNAYHHAAMRLNNIKTKMANDPETMKLREAIDAL
jgi:hypothetical protein